MKLKNIEGCNCNHPEIMKEHPEGCTLNQVIDCHGNQPLNEFLKHIQPDDNNE